MTETLLKRQKSTGQFGWNKAYITTLHDAVHSLDVNDIDQSERSICWESLETNYMHTDWMGYWVRERKTHRARYTLRVNVSNEINQKYSDLMSTSTFKAYWRVLVCYGTLIGAYWSAYSQIGPSFQYYASNDCWCTLPVLELSLQLWVKKQIRRKPHTQTWSDVTVQSRSARHIVHTAADTHNGLK